MKGLTVFLIALTIVGVATFFRTEETRFLKSALQVDSLPSETRVLDRATWSWTDYRKELFISFGGDHRVLLSGREWEKCYSPAGSNFDFAAALRVHTPTSLTSCLTSGDWQSSGGQVQIAMDEAKTMAVIIYTVD